MIPYPHIDPEIVRIGPFAIRWYGLMYAVGFASSYVLVRQQLRKMGQGSGGKGRDKNKGQGSGGKGQGSSGKGHEKIKAGSSAPAEFLDALYTYLVVGLILGARIGYVLFYDLSSYLSSPLEIFAVWHGGMSFHGGAMGLLIAGYVCCKRYGMNYWQIADMVTVTAPIGLAAGRLGNFINGELYGRVTDVPWAMVFPTGGPLPRHPSQVYEFLLEGVLLFTILWLAKERKHVAGTMVALCLVLYGIFRFTVEFFRQPDAQLGFVIGPFTMGQLLSIATLLAGIILFYLRKRSAAA
jgi:phosphatidylglycerol:prolipoprotein diacylglycerol transferase